MPTLNKLMATPGLSRRGSKALGTIAGLSAAGATQGGSNTLFRETTSATQSTMATAGSDNNEGNEGSKRGVRNTVVVDVKRPTPETNQQAI